MHLVKELEKTLSTDTAPVRFETMMSSPAAESASCSGIEKTHEGMVLEKKLTQKTTKEFDRSPCQKQTGVAGWKR